MTQLDEGAIRAVAELANDAAKVQREKIGDYEFADRKLERIDLDPKLPPLLDFYTLEGFAAYVEKEPAARDALIHVVGPTSVLAIGALEGQDKNLRRMFARASYSASGFGGFEFNDYTDLETLTIALQTRFDREVKDCVELLKFCSQVRQTASVGVADDGVSQTVEARRGVAAVLTTAVKNPWYLAPYRTFSEVEQPDSPYVLRFRSHGEGSLPHGALFETGDASWKVDAVNALSKWLRVRLEEHTILG